jgi:hypothetical protein
VRSPSTRFKSFVLLPVAAAAVLSTSGCDTKAGTAAVVNGHKISESDLNSYLTLNAKKIGDPTTGTPPRTFVLKTLILDEILPSLLAQTKGGAVTDDELRSASADALQGGTEADLTDIVTKQGLTAKFEPLYLRFLKYGVVLNTRVSSEAEFNDALKAANVAVSVNPRYGSWDPSTLSLKELSAADLPANVKLSGQLPGDRVPSAAPSAP